MICHFLYGCEMWSVTLRKECNCLLSVSFVRSYPSSSLTYLDSKLYQLTANLFATPRSCFAFSSVVFAWIYLQVPVHLFYLNINNYNLY